MQVEVSHGLDREGAAARVQEAIRRMDLETVESTDPGRGEQSCGGTVVKRTPLGSVEASWEASDTRVVVTVLKKPAWLSEEAIRKPLEEGLRQALSG